MKNAGICMIALAAILATGCNSQLNYSQEMRKITIESAPPGALVYQMHPVTDEKIFLGTTPLEKQTVLVPTGVTSLGRNTSRYAAQSQIGMVRVVIEKDGYVPFVSNLATDREDILRHDVVLERQ